MNDHVADNLRQLFEAAIALDPGDRAAYLESHCIDESQRAAVERLLAADRVGAPRLLDTPINAVLERLGDVNDTLATPATGTTIGPFALLEKIGEGGSSIVFRARREQSGVEQFVALKLLRRGIYSAEDQRQFRRERLALAQLQHSGIARLIEGGVTEKGIPYIALELIDGWPITDYVQSGRLDLRARLKAFVAVCNAVDAAHRALIVHRDLKPSNVLVTREGDIKLLDFGIAKLLDADSRNETRTQHAAMTPAYAAPEQFNGGPITTATDVYALGILLNELLTGERRDAGDIHTPSSHIIDHAAPGVLPASAAATRRLLRGDLDNIVMKATALEPERRYASADAFAEDIERHLGGRPVRAHSPSTWYRTTKFVSRHRGVVATTAMFLVIVFTALGVALWQANIARHQARIALQQAQRADAVQEFLVDVFKTNTSSQDDPIKARAMTARDLLEIGAKKIDGAMADAPEAKLHLLVLLGDLHSDLGLNENAARLYLKAVDLAHATYGDYAPEAVDAQMKLADALHTANSDEQARTVLEQAQVALDHNHDENPRRRANLFDQFAQYYTPRNVPLALDYARNAVALYERSPASGDTARALYRKARIEHQSNLIADSIASYERAIEISTSIDGGRNPIVLHYYAELAQQQYFHHDIAEGERNARNALQLAKAINGENHIDVVECEMRLGRLLADTGRLREGLSLLASAKRKILALRGPEDGFHATQVLFQNGALLIRAGRIEEGIMDLDMAIANQRRNRPGTIPLAQFLEIAAAAQIELGQDSPASKNLDESKAIREKAGQKIQSWSFDSNIIPRIRLALAEKQYDRATELLPALSVSDDDPEQLDLDNINNALLAAEVESASGRWADSISHARTIRRNIESSRLAAYYQPLVARANFIEGSADLNSGDARAAIPLLTLALTERESDLDAFSPEIGETELALAECFLAEADFAKARAALDVAIAIDAAHPELESQYRKNLKELQTKLAHHPATYAAASAPVTQHH